MADLLFSFEEMLEEIHSMSAIGAEFITAETREIVIQQLISNLESIRTSRPRTSKAWTVVSERPLRTIDSDGEYQYGARRGRQTIFGEVTFIWEILCPEEGGPRNRPQRKFTLSGKSSTKVRIFERSDEGQLELATWRFEVGDNASPGCHFHIQLEGARTDPPYPKWLSVPRLPTVLITPMAALEFLLGEMFQSRWEKHAAMETAEMKRWRPIQKKRLKRLLKWQSDFIEDCGGSPWTAFKAHKPDEDLFVRSQ